MVMYLGSNHILRVVRLGLAAILGMAVVASAFADNAVKSPGKKTVVVPLKAVQYGSPGFGPADLIVTAMGKVASSKQAKQPVQPVVANTRDTAASENKIVSTVATADVFTTVVSVAAAQTKLDIGIYNMLGKRMADVYTGGVARGMHEFTTPITQLPDGVYICIMQGSNFRRASKFYLSR